MARWVSALRVYKSKHQFDNPNPVVYNCASCEARMALNYKNLSVPPMLFYEALSRTARQLISKPKIFLIPLILGGLLSAPVFADTIDWKIGPSTLDQLNATDTEKLLSDALRYSVPPELLDQALGLLFDESNPDVIPDEIEVKKRLFGLIIAQQKIKREEEKNKPFSADAIRQQSIASVNNLYCNVLLAFDTKPGAFSREFRGTLSEDESKKLRAYGKKLDTYKSELEKSLADKTGKTTPPSVPAKPQINNPGKAAYDALSKREKDKLHSKLKKEALRSFSCSKGTCFKHGKCKKTVTFTSDEDVADREMTQMYYKISAVPHCGCSSR